MSGILYWLLRYGPPLAILAACVVQVFRRRSLPSIIMLIGCVGMAVSRTVALACLEDVQQPIRVHRGIHTFEWIDRILNVSMHAWPIAFAVFALGFCLSIAEANRHSRPANEEPVAGEEEASACEPDGPREQTSQG